MSLSLGQLKTQVRTALTKARAKQRDAKRLGFYSLAGWDGPAEVKVDETVWRVAEARSPLAARELLANAPQDERLLMICGVTEEQLGSDLMARFGVPRLLRPNHVESLKDLFQSASVDPRILTNLPFVDLLADHSPDRGFGPAPNGHLTAELFWTQLLSRVWAMPTGSPDLIGLIRWTLDPASCQRFRESDDEFRKAAANWIEQSAGTAAHAVLRSLNEPSNPAAITLGLACGVLFHPSASGDQSLAQARVRVERFLNHQPVAPHEALQWATSSSAVMGALAAESPSEALALVRQLDGLLQTLQVSDRAALSPWSQLGFDANIDTLAKELQRFLASPPSPAGLSALVPLVETLSASRLAAHNSARIVRAQMTVRLCSWLLNAEDPPTETAIRSLPASVEHYLNEQSFVDWARACLCNGDASPAMAEAIRQLLQAVSPRRNRFNEVFAGLLAAWTPSHDASAGLIPIHKVLADVVAPAGDTAPVLLVVLDGMSAAVFDELTADLSVHGWRSVLPTGRHRPLILSGIPSITEISRTSLLSGRLQVGGQAEELAGFSGSPELRHRSRTGPPKLFHKGMIASSEDGNLSSDVSDAIGSATRFVGVVINAIDDHLAKGDQLALSWNVGSIRVLPSLLARARDAGRLVIIVSDHGHLLDQGTRQTTGSDSDRYRKPSPAPADGEVLLYPSRTGLGVDDEAVVLAWSESLRYCGRKNGYHGGVSPQETVVPLAILWHGATLPEGWSEFPMLPPAWWSGEQVSALVVTTKTISKPAPVAPASLFEPSAPEPVRISQPEPPPWLTRLVESELFKAQRARAGRNVQSPEEVGRFLHIMLLRGGKLTRPALARSLNMPELRVGGYVSQIRRILNVEGYPIVHVHEESSTIELNEPLLKAQFDIS